MDFSLTEEQQAFQETAERFSREKLAPLYMERDRDDGLDRDLVREMGALGLIGPDLPEELGGLGLGGVTTGIIAEAIAYGDMNVCYVPLLGSLLGQIIVRNANADLAREWVPRIVKGEAIVGLGLTEPRGGSDAANLQLRAGKVQGGYLLNGEKTSMSFAGGADAAVVFARTGPLEDGGRAVSAFMVGMQDDGVTTTRFSDIGSKLVGRGSVFFDDVFVPDDHMIGDENMGFVQVMQGFDYSRALIGLQCIAAAQASLDETWAYIQEREAFGAPLAQYQGVSFPLAESETYLTMARQLCYYALDLRDRGQPHTAEASMCKWYGPKVAHEVIQQCLLTHGHYGYSGDLPHQQRMRDVLGLQIGDGTAQIMKLVIAREKAGRVAVQHAVRKSPSR
ncbi:acyl-CoA dehydrogenase family protein [Hwanghaeella sp.]|uniref:acyl-CoA dehydrogenase family protein n=1 Tax=Hwanghaeella sp. TaxID=2605943 RepID=UPI003CCB95C3